MSLPLVHRWEKQALTQTAGTSIQLNIPPSLVATKNMGKAVVTKFRLTTGGTAHTITFLRPLGLPTTLTAAAAAAQKNYVLAADPTSPYTALNGTATSRVANRGIAANDNFCVELADGTFFFDTVNTWTAGTLTLVGTTNVPTGGALKGAKIWILGVTTDTADPRNPSGDGLFVLKPPISQTGYSYDDIENGIVGTYGAYEPMIIIDPNATAADTIEQVCGVYSNF